MAILKVFTVRDVKSESYMPPFTMRTKGEAIRSFSDTANSKDSGIGSHPEDYVLFYLGEYDELTAKFDLTSAPEAMGVALDYVRPVTV